ncbi:MAG: hypothetical protein JEZ12_24100 [Desulfobacterium sp.]|nr:hypothetical protein [Desulfobacterium sp.]
MPTFRNDSGVQQTIENLGGNQEIVSPGETIETYQFYNIPGLTQLSETPLKNRNAAMTEVPLGAEVPHVLNSETRKILVINITGTCTVKPQETTAVPVMLNNTETSIIMPINLEHYPCDKLLVSGSGTCTIVEFKW